MTPKLFSELGLSPELVKAIDKLGFEQAAPIQAEAIPILLAGHDVAGRSQTGSGKTAAFAIPAVEKVDVTKRTVQILILCPTRELAVQVSEEVHKLAIFKRGLHALPIYGGQSYDRQFLGLKQGAQIVIGTPGRVMDHMRRGTLRFDALKMVILDEVDVMLNMGFRDDIELILQATPKERQTVFFSATIPPPIQQLIERYARNPQNIRIEQKAMTVPTVEQVYYEVDRRYKIELLTRLIDIHDLKLGIIFCNTKRMVDDLVDHLNAQGYSADRLHGDMSQMMRDRVMQKFRKSGLEFLVATDVAARGIDVDDVEVVFNYDLPYDGEDYVHRIGRTGRKGRSGRAISFASGREVFQIRNIERYTNMRIQRGRVPTVNEVEEARATVFLDKLRVLLTSGEYRRHDHLIERLLEEGFASTDIASALIHYFQVGAEAAPAKGTKSEGAGTSPVADRPARPAAAPAPKRTEAVTRVIPIQEAVARTTAPAAPAPATVVAAPVKPVPASAPAVSSVKVPAAPRVESPVAKVAAPVTPAKIAAPKPAAKIPEVKRPISAQAAKIIAKPDPAPALADEPKVEGRPRPSRATPEGQTRLWMGLGEEMGVVPIDIVNSIAGETGLPGKVVGKVDIRERHLFVDVISEHANAIIAKLKRAEIKGHKVKVKLA